MDKNENIYKCAARELFEESLGVFCSQKTAKKILKNHKKNGVFRVNNDAMQCMAYILPIQLSDNPMKKFQEKRKNATSACQKEVLEIVAMKASSVVKKLKNGDANFRNSLRGCVYSTLQLALEKKKL